MGKRTTKDWAKLPVWVKNELDGRDRRIANLERDIAQLTGHDETDIYWEQSAEQGQHFLPQHCTITIASSGGKFDIWLDGDGRLRVSCMRNIEVHPIASNTFSVSAHQ